MQRRNFLKQISYGAASMGIMGTSLHPPSTDRPDDYRLPYKIGIRQASLRNPEEGSQNMVANFDTFKVARDIPGISGMELQVTNGSPNMRDLAVARRYKAEAHRWGLDIPTTAGVWSHSQWGPHTSLDLTRSIRASEIVGASIMLVAFFRDDAPDMSDEASYGPVVSILKEVAPIAEEAGIILGLENSLSPEENKMLVEMIDHPAVKVYYDLDNMYRYGHGDAAVPGIELLGNEWIAAVHVKNNGRIVQDHWRIDWAAALEALTDIDYDGWLIFESQHEDHDQCKEMTKQNIAFIKQYFHPPQYREGVSS